MSKYIEQITTSGFAIASNISETKKQTYTATQLELREYFVGRAFNAGGTNKRGGQLADARNATCSNLTDMVFRELCNAGVK